MKDKGKVKVQVTAYDFDTGDEIDEAYIEVTGYATLVVEDGSVSTAMSYYEYVEIDYNKLQDLVEEYFGRVDYDYYVLEDSFEDDVYVKEE